MVSMLANSYDQNAKLLNGAHKSHVHSIEEVSLYIYVCVLPFPLYLEHKMKLICLLLGGYTFKVQAYH